MKVLRVIVTMHPSYGGPCQGIRNSIPAMKELGIENEVVCLDNKDLDYGMSDGFLIHKIGNGVGPYKYNVSLNNWLNSNFNRFDLVIIHGLWLYTSYGTFRAWNNFKRSNLVFPKLYVMPHGMLDPYFQLAPERRLKAMRNTIFWHLFEKKVINGVDGVLFTCEMEKELAKESFNDYLPLNEINVGYGIQTPPLFIPEMEEEFLMKSGLTKDQPFILFLSRIHSKKGVDYLIKSYVDLVEGGKYRDIPKLVIAGPTSNRYAQGLMGSVANRNDVIFTGMLQGNAKWGALYLSGAFILPSHQENFGIAVVEALACGTPVLITDKINIWKEIEEGRGGLVKDDTLEGTKGLLQQWFSLPPEDREFMAKSAKNTFLKYFTVKSAAVQFLGKLSSNDIKS
ncbi:glycosyltransferase involved in cell wall biosynthesis [Algoriphagus sp. 4150]|uniref:glycosyltransferase n=1 Tax=Algoriphagus sp. 4150 TaxID=2817756 RepID=UPI002859DD1A|nr:glycosyltransferase [Algoriphagus sp. 4150]MDR7127777.1 glycosyltransferase involved in cell wall biosynthesis [Algoriphagus sp. 4150]